MEISDLQYRGSGTPTVEYTPTLADAGMDIDRLPQGSVQQRAPSAASVPVRVEDQSASASTSGRICRIPHQITAQGSLTPYYDQLMHQAGLSVFSYATRIHNIQQVELALVEEALCTTQDPTLALEYQVIAPYLNYDALELLLDQEGYLIGVQQNLACILMSLFHNIPEYNPINYTRQRIRRWLNWFAQLGGTSVEGIVFATSLTINTDFMAIKIPRKTDTLVHEALIGLYVTNYVKRWVINFPYTYGYTTCSPMVVSKDFDSGNPVTTSSNPNSLHTQNVVTWCTSDKSNSSVLVLENVRESETLSHYLRERGADLTVPMITGLMWQVINAMAVAGVQCELTHYDLHLGNILIKWHEHPPSQTLYWQGDVNRPIGHIVSENVLYVIDFGLGHALVKGQHFGRIQLEQYGISASSARPVYDLNFMLLSWGSSLKRTDPLHPALLYFNRLYRIWSPTSLIDDIKLLDAYVPGKGMADVRRRWIPEYEQFTWPILWERMWNVMTPEEKDFYRPLGSQVNIDLSLPMDSCRFAAIVNIDSTPRDPITFNDSYNALSALDNGSSILSGNKSDQMYALLIRFNFLDYLADTGIDQLEEYLDKAEGWLYTMNIPKLNTNPIIVGVNSYRMFSPEFYQWYQQQWYHLLGIYDQLHLFQTLFYNITTTQQIYQINYPDQQFPLPDEFNQVSTRANELWARAKGWRDRIIAEIISVRATYKNDPRLREWEEMQATYLNITENS